MFLHVLPVLKETNFKIFTANVQACFVHDYSENCIKSVQYHQSKCRNILYARYFNLGKRSHNILCLVKRYKHIVHVTWVFLEQKGGSDSFKYLFHVWKSLFDVRNSCFMLEIVVSEITHSNLRALSFEPVCSGDQNFQLNAEYFCDTVT